MNWTTVENEYGDRRHHAVGEVCEYSVYEWPKKTTVSVYTLEEGSEVLSVRVTSAGLGKVACVALDCALVAWASAWGVGE